MRLKIYSFLLLLSLFFVFTITSCSDNDLPAGYNYPSMVGNQWEYSTRVIQQYTNNSGTIDIDTLTSTNTVKVESTNETINSRNAVLFSETTFDYIGRISQGFNYYEITEDVMQLLAYKGGAFMSMPKRSDHEIVRVNGCEFSSIDELYGLLELNNKYSSTMDDSLIIESVPCVVYSYPLDIGKEWIYRHYTTPSILIQKKVISIENVATEAGTFECYKIQWQYDLNNDSVWDDDIEYYDYVSISGLIKRTMHLTSVVMTDPENPDGDTILEMISEMNLNSLSIQEEI